MKFTCPHCKRQFPIDVQHWAAHERGKSTSPEKAAAARKNGKKGGRKARVGPPILPPNEHGL